MWAPLRFRWRDPHPRPGPRRSPPASKRTSRGDGRGGLTSHFPWRLWTPPGLDSGSVPARDGRPPRLCCVLAAAAWAGPRRHSGVKRRDGSPAETAVPPRPPHSQARSRAEVWPCGPRPRGQRSAARTLTLRGAGHPAWGWGGRAGADAARRELGVGWRDPGRALGGGRRPRTHREVQWPPGTVDLTQGLEARAGQGAAWGCRWSPLQSPCGGAGGLLGCARGVEGAQEQKAEARQASQVSLLLELPGGLAGPWGRGAHGPAATWAGAASANWSKWEHRRPLRKGK